MRFIQLVWFILGVMIVAPALTGCKTGDGIASDAGASGSAGTGRGGGGGAIESGGTGGNGDRGTGGAGSPIRDCFPACVSNLGRNCERPNVDGGTCTTGANAICCSNGIHEIPTVVDGGELVFYTADDGTTNCYQVFVDSDFVQHFQTLAGQDVAQAMHLDAGVYAVTCDGATVNVNIYDPACAELNSGYCQTGTCNLNASPWTVGDR